MTKLHSLTPRSFLSHSRTSHSFTLRKLSEVEPSEVESSETEPSEAEFDTGAWKDAFRVVRIVQSELAVAPQLRSAIAYPGFEYAPGCVTAPRDSWGPIAVFEELSAAVAFVSDANEVVVRCKYTPAPVPGLWDDTGYRFDPFSPYMPLGTHFASAVWLPDAPYCTIEELLDANPDCYVVPMPYRRRAYQRVWEWYWTWRQTGSGWDWAAERRELYELSQRRS